MRALTNRLLRWLIFTGVAAAAVFGLVGRFDLPMVDAVLVLSSALVLAASLTLDPDLARERFRPGQKGEDSGRLLAIRLLVLVTLVGALLDVGRFHRSDGVPVWLQAAAFAVLALSFAWTLWAMVVNRYFVPVVRIQSERGHQVVTTGPYARVRHPGYLGMVFCAPAAALAIGSWLALVPALVASWLFVRRASHEDRFLRARLEGYEDYARHVPYRLLPGVW